jgi:hypothetical protein
MYIIKVKGVAKIPDYVQLRDDEFTLLAYFRVDRPEKVIRQGRAFRQGRIYNECSKRAAFRADLKIRFLTTS